MAAGKAGQTMLQQLKKSLRKDLKQMLRNMSPDDRQRQSKTVRKMLFNLYQYQTASRVSVFLSMPTEIDTFPIAADIFNNGKECFVPRYSGERMEMVKLKNFSEIDTLPETKWKIKQPGMDEIRDDALTSVGFTEDGKRLGQGAGYYDRFFTQYRQKFGKMPFTVAVAFKEQILDTVPVSENDIPVDRVLFEGCGVARPAAPADE